LLYLSCHVSYAPLLVPSLALHTPLCRLSFARYALSDLQFPSDLSLSLLALHPVSLSTNAYP
jgi:hypothetical protein